MWNKFQYQLTLLPRRHANPPAYSRTSSLTDPQLYQRDVLDWSCSYALAYLLTGDRAHLDNCKRWVLASCSYPTWGTGGQLNSDLAAGHQLAGLSLVYDWLHNDLDDDTRTTIRRTLIERAPFMYEGARKTFWRNRILDNHVHVALTGLTATALTLADDPTAGPQARQWLQESVSRMRLVAAALPHDGATHEGVTYWDYGTRFQLMFWQMAEGILGIPQPEEWFQNTAWYWIYLTMPRKNWLWSEPLLVDIADASRRPWNGPDVLLRRLASQYRIAEAQWCADETARLDIARYETGWQNFLWHQPDLPAEPPSNIPTFRHFEDIGIVSARTDWSGEESLLVFKCGAPLGKSGHQLWAGKPNPAVEGDANHAHPDANHFVLLGAGEYLIRDDGYTELKMTDRHNTLLVAGRGQMGEGDTWFDDTPYRSLGQIPEIIRAHHSQTLDYIEGEAASAYPQSLRLKRFRRHLLFVKPSALIIVDDIEMESAATLELLLHPEPETEPANSVTFLSRGKKAILRTEVLTHTGVEVTLGRTRPMRNNDGQTFSMPEIRMKTSRAKWRHAVALTWSTTEPPTATLTEEGDNWTFALGDRNIVFRWDGSLPEEITA